MRPLQDPAKKRRSESGRPKRPTNHDRSGGMANTMDESSTTRATIQAVWTIQSIGDELSRLHNNHAIPMTTLDANKIPIGTAIACSVSVRLLAAHFPPTQRNASRTPVTGFKRK